MRRKLYRYERLPFFTGYTLYSIFASSLRKVGNNDYYYNLYWSTEALYAILALLALNEVFRRLHRFEYQDYRWFQFLLPLTSTLIVGFAIWAMFYSPLTHIPRVVSAVFWFDLGVHTLEAAIPLLFLLLRPIFSPPKSPYDLGILWGFAISASITIVVDATRSTFGQGYEKLFRYGPPVGYAFATLIWLRAFYRPPDWKPASKETIDSMLAIMTRTQRALRRLLKDLGLRTALLLIKRRQSGTLILTNFRFSEQTRMVSVHRVPMCVNTCRSTTEGHYPTIMFKPVLLRVVLEIFALFALRAVLGKAMKRGRRSVDEVIEPLRKVDEVIVSEVFDQNKERAMGFWKVRIPRSSTEVAARVSDADYLKQLSLDIHATPSEATALKAGLTEKLVFFWHIDLSMRGDQRGRLDLVREIIRRMLHNAQVVREWGSTEAFFMNELRADDTLYDQKQLARVLRLRKCALKVNICSRLLLAKLSMLMLTPFDKTRFLPMPSVAGLRKLAGIDLLDAYGELREAALELGKEYGQEYAGSLAAAM